MKVLYLAPEGGEGRLTAMSFIDEELQALRRNGIEVHVIAPDIDDDSLLDGIPKRSVRKLVGTRDVTSFAARRLPQLSLHHALGDMRYVGYVLKAECAAAVLAADEDFDLIHSHFGSFGGIGGRLAADLAELPLVSSFRGMDLACEPEHNYGLRQRPFFDSQIRKLLHSADATLYVSDYMRHIGISLGAPPDRARTVRKGVDLDGFCPPADDTIAKERLGLNGFVILTVASLLPRKGVDIVLRAIAALADDHRVRYIVCGDGPERKRLEALSESLGIKSLVTFAGRVTRSDIPHFFAAADVFVMTSLFEASGNVYLEAQASGIPVVCSDSGGPPEYIIEGETGFSVPYGDVSQLADRVRMLSDEPIRRKSMGRAARAWMERGFGYERMENDILSAYNFVAKSERKVV